MNRVRFVLLLILLWFMIRALVSSSLVQKILVFKKELGVYLLIPPIETLEEYLEGLDCILNIHLSAQSHFRVSSGDSNKTL